MGFLKVYPLDLCYASCILTAYPHSDNAVVNLFADDALVYSSGHNIPELVLNIQNELNTVTNWMTLNKLKINVEKSSFIMFGFKHKITINSTDEIALCINDEKLKYTPTLKYLGITLDETLSWGAHVDNICKKTGQRNGIYKTLILPLSWIMPCLYGVGHHRIT